MHRNLDRRVEALVRVTLPSAQDDLRNVLELAMSPESEGWDLDGAGDWHRRTFTPSEHHVHLQEALLRRIIGKAN
jgi:polyphosphate kinase